MPFRLVPVVLLFVLSAGLLTALSVPSVQAQRLSEPAGGFSYQPPAGWHIRTFPGLKYKISYAMPRAGFAPNINAVDEVSAVPLDKYVQLSMAGLKRSAANLHILSQKPFISASGVQGERVIVDGIIAGKHLHEVFYVFPASNNRKIVLTASSLASDHGKYDPSTDASLKSFKLQ